LVALIYVDFLRAARQQAGFTLARVLLQRRPVTHKPDMPERVCEPTLPVDAPWHPVIPDIVKLPHGTCFQGACDESIRVVTEHFDPCGRDPKL
jgi:hypothetical protein